MHLRIVFERMRCLDDHGASHRMAYEDERGTLLGPGEQGMNHLHEVAGQCRE